MLRTLRRVVPKSVKRAYHRALSTFAKWYYRSPSERLIVIGVTGTSGKSTVVYLLARILEKAGFRVGVASTIFFKVDKKEWLNDRKMTMVGRLELQRLLAQMAKANCQYAIVETTSEGIEQFRHAGINYDTTVFTNLYPEHIEAHGSFENYKAAKLKLFAKLAGDPVKLLHGQKIPKTIIANLDDQHAKDFLQFDVPEKIAFTFTNASSESAKIFRGEDLQESADGVQFTLARHPFRLRLLGKHNAYNALAAICVGRAQGLSLAAIGEHLADIQGIPGRTEFIDEGQKFRVIVDYAFEPKALGQLYAVVGMIRPKKIIHVLGGTGGGRDQARRPKIGALAGGRATVVIVTNEDPYDENPETIMRQVAAGAQSAGKLEGTDLFLVLDRRQAIAQALRLARSGDVVLVTGKGSEQAIVEKNNKKIPWDDRSVIREELSRILKNK